MRGDSPVFLCPTFFHGGVQLRDLDGQPVDAVLQGVGAQIEGVGLVKQLAEYILCMLAWGKRRSGGTKKGQDM